MVGARVKATSKKKTVKKVSKPKKPALKKAKEEVFRCAMGCGYPVPYQGAICGECACEDDCE